MKEPYLSTIKRLREQLAHKEKNCPLVTRRIACLQCGYPESEAMWPSVEKYLQSLGYRA